MKMSIRVIRRIAALSLSWLISVVLAFCSDSAAAGSPAKYTVTAAISPGNGEVSGDVAILWRNDLVVPLKTIPLSFCNWAEVDQDKLSDLIDELVVNGQPAKLRWKRKEGEDDYLGFDLLLGNEIKPNATADIRMKFKSGKYAYKYSYYRYLEDWFPMILQTKDGRPNLKWPTLSEFNITLTYPSDYKVALSGSITSRRENDGQVILHSTARDIPSFGVLISKDFLVEEGEAGGVKIISYFLKGDEKWGKSLLEYSRDIIPFYQQEIGFYPQPVLYILPGYPDRPAGGYPVCPNCIVVHRNLDSLKERAPEFARWITAHEIGHQYWGYGYILEDLDFPRWFGLSMGIYTDRLYAEARGLFSDPYRNFTIRYLGGILADVDTTILQKQSELNKLAFDWNNVISHGKSYTVLTMLETYLGPYTLKKIFRESLKRYKGKIVTLEIFKSLCEEISNKDLGWFFHQWYRTNAYLDYRIAASRTRKEDRAFITEAVIVRRGVAVMPLEVELECSDGRTHVKTIDGWNASTTVRFETNVPPVRVVLDPREKLPLLSKAEASEKAITAALTELDYMKNFSEGPQLLRLLGNLRPETVLFHCWSGLVSRFQGSLKIALEHFQKALELKHDADYDNYKDMIVLQLGKTCDLLGNREEALKYYKQIPQNSRYRRSAELYSEVPYNSFKDSR
jgi:tetratricopeptide (TPR) repeat protein